MESSPLEYQTRNLIKGCLILKLKSYKFEKSLQRLVKEKVIECNKNITFILKFRDQIYKIDSSLEDFSQVLNSSQNDQKQPETPRSI